jgi:hypothetical protein
MDNAAFAQSVRPPRFVILRLPMEPYSIGHEILLWEKSNPIIALSPDEFKQLPELDQRKAIISAVLICCRDWEENKSAHKWVRLWGWMIRKENFALAIADFWNYRAWGTTLPKLQPSNKAGRPLGAPHASRMLAYALKLPDAYNAPLGMVQWLYYAEAEAEGGCEIQNYIQDEVEKMTEEIRKEREAKAKEGLSPRS